MGALHASKSGLGAPQGQRRQSGGCFVRVSRARVPRADVTRLFWEPNIRIYFFRVLNVQIVSFFGNRIFDLPRTREVVGLVLMHQSHDVAL